MLALAGATDAQAAAYDVLERAAQSALTLTLDGTPVRAACGTLVTPSHGLTSAPPLDDCFVLSDLP